MRRAGRRAARRAPGLCSRSPCEGPRRREWAERVSAGASGSGGRLGCRREELPPPGSAVTGCGRSPVPGAPGVRGQPRRVPGPAEPPQLGARVSGRKSAARPLEAASERRSRPAAGTVRRKEAQPVRETCRFFQLRGKRDGVSTHGAMLRC